MGRKSNFYIIDNSTEIEDTNGVYPQVDFFSQKDDYKENYDFGKLQENKFPDVAPDLHTVYVKSQTLLTDFLSIYGGNGAVGFLISQKVVNILEKVKIVNYKLYSVNKVLFNYKEINSKYWYLHLVSDLIDKINFNESKFYYRPPFCRQIGVSDGWWGVGDWHVLYW